MKRTFVLFLLIASAACLHGQSPISGPSYYTRSVVFANLSTPLAGNFRYCTDCTATAPCADSGTGAWAFRTGSVWNCTDGGATFSGVTSIAGPELVAPSLTSATGDTASGTLAADTYYYVITAVDQFGFESPISTERSDTIAAPGKITLSWSAYTGAQGFNIYRGLTPGGQTEVHTSISVAGSSGLTSFVDEGSVAFNPSAIPAATGGRLWAINTLGDGGAEFGYVVAGQGYFTGVPGNDSLIVVGPSEFSGNAGIGVAPSGVAGEKLIVESTGNEINYLKVRNTNTGNAARSVIQAVSDTSIISIQANGSGTTNSEFGAVAAGYSAIRSPTGSGIMIGTTFAAPVILGTNAVAVVNLSGAGVVTLPRLAVTAGTMTGTSEAVVSTVTTCRSWTNAQVAALAGTAGDIAWGTLPAKTIVRNAYVVITGAAAGPATVTVAVGRVAAGYIDYIVASDAKAAANTVYGDASGERGTNLTGYDLPSYTGTTVINAHFVSTGGDLSTTTGSTGMVCLTLDKLP